MRLFPAFQAKKRPIKFAFRPRQTHARPSDFNYDSCSSRRASEEARIAQETLPGFLKDKGVSLELWQSTHDDVVSHYKSYYNCCNAFWFNIFWFILLPMLTLPIFFCYRANFESGWTAIMHKHGADYKKSGLKMEVVMIPDKCGREKTVGLRFLNKDGYNAPPV